MSTYLAVGPDDADDQPSNDGDREILVASSHGPGSFHRDDDGTLTFHLDNGGMVRALSALPEQTNALWVCAALSDEDRAGARAAGDGRLDLAGYEAGPTPLRMLDIEALTFSRAYHGVADSILWFINHMLYDTARSPVFDGYFRREWSAYVDYNAAFAEAIAEEASAGARVFVQDYHLNLVPQLLREHRTDLAIAYFSHTPWAPPDYFQILPDDVAVALLEGVLAANHVGFATTRWARAFLDCCESVLGARVDSSTNTIEYAGRRTSVGTHSFGVGAEDLRQRAEQPDVEARMVALRGLVGGRRMILRVDRAEVGTNAVRGLAAYRDLLRKHPEWHGRVVHLVFAASSQNGPAEYHEYIADVQRMTKAIVDEFASPDWDPIVIAKDDDHASALAAYRMADVALVNPVRDGMNLVAKQIPVLSDRGCALVLSREAGAAADLGEHAILVNPFDIEATSDALHQALGMRGEERRKRGAGLATAATTNPPDHWFSDQLTALRS